MQIQRTTNPPQIISNGYHIDGWPSKNSQTTSSYYTTYYVLDTSNVRRSKKPMPFPKRFFRFNFGHATQLATVSASEIAAEIDANPNLKQWQQFQRFIPIFIQPNNLNRDERRFTGGGGGGKASGLPDYKPPSPHKMIDRFLLVDEQIQV